MLRTRMDGKGTDVQAAQFYADHTAMLTFIVTNLLAFQVVLSPSALATSTAPPSGVSVSAINSTYTHELSTAGEDPLNGTTVESMSVTMGTQTPTQDVTNNSFPADAIGTTTHLEFNSTTQPTSKPIIAQSSTDLTITDSEHSQSPSETNQNQTERYNSSDGPLSSAESFSELATLNATSPTLDQDTEVSTLLMTVMYTDSFSETAPPTNTAVPTMSTTTVTEQSATTIEQSVTTIEQSATTIEQSATTIELPVTTIEQLATTIEQPATTIGQSATTIELPVPATTIELPVTTIELPVTTIGQPATTIELPVATVEQSVTTVKQPATTIGQSSATQPNLTASMTSVQTMTTQRLLSTRQTVPRTRTVLPSSPVRTISHTTRPTSLAITMTTRMSLGEPSPLTTQQWIGIGVSIFFAIVLLIIIILLLLWIRTRHSLQGKKPSIHVSREDYSRSSTLALKDPQWRQSLNMALQSMNTHIELPKETGEEMQAVDNAAFVDESHDPQTSNSDPSHLTKV